MKSFFIAYVASLLTFLLVDAIWLGLIAKRFYAEQLGGLMRTDVFWPPAALFYLFYALAIVILAIRPSDTSQTVGSVFVLGMVVGLVAYGTYNATNLATLKDWPAMMSVVDLVWGTLLSGTVAVSGFLALSIVNR